MVNSYRVLADVSNLLRDHLWSAFETESGLSGLVPDRESIVLERPDDTLWDPAHRLSVWLMDVRENQQYASRPSPGFRLESEPVLMSSPQHYDLTYMITPLTDAAEGDLLLLGKVLDTFHEQPILVLDRGDEQDQVRVVPQTMSLAELSVLWRGLGASQRPTAIYTATIGPGRKD